MTLLAPKEGEIRLLQRLVNLGPFNDPMLKLFTNDYTPIDASVKANFTELAKAGYAAKRLTGANWSVTAVGATGQATFAQMTFTLTGQCTSYGYFVTNQGATHCLWAERFSDGPYTIPSGGGSIKITPKIELE